MSSLPSLRAIAGLAALVFALFVTPLADAQTVTNAFGGLSDVSIAIVDPWERTYTTVDRSHITVLPRSQRNLFHVTPYTLVSVVIVRNNFLGLLPRDANSL